MQAHRHGRYPPVRLELLQDARGRIRHDSVDRVGHAQAEYAHSGRVVAAIREPVRPLVHGEERPVHPELTRNLLHHLVRHRNDIVNDSAQSAA
jgi:hypothetical protein